MLKSFMFKKISEFNRRNLTNIQFSPQTRRLLSLERRLLYRELSKRQKRTGQLPNESDQIWDILVYCTRITVVGGGKRKEDN